MAEVCRIIEPIAYEADASYEYPAEMIRRVAEAGFFAYVILEAYGGKGLSSVNVCIIGEEFGKVCICLD